MATTTPGEAQTALYWDTNGATAGAGGAAPSGTWKTSGAANKKWSTSSAGTSATAVWTNGDIAVFSAGGDATGSYTVTVATGTTVDSIIVEEGDITFNSSALTLTGTTPGVDVAGGLTATFNTKFLGPNGFVKEGAGTLVLNNTGNNYTGDTLVNAGTLLVGAGTNILPNATAVSVASGASLQFVAGGYTQTLASLSGAGSVDFADNTFKSGDTTNTTFAGSLSGTGTLIKLGTGTLTLSGNNSSLSSALSLSAGNIVAASANALGSASINLSSGAALQFAGGVSSAPADVTVRGTGDGTGALRSLGGANTLAAGVTLAAASTIATDAGSTFTISGDITRTGQDLTVGGAGSTVLSGGLSGSGAGQLIKEGSGTLTLSGGSANTFAGAVAVNDGTLALDKTAGTDATGGGGITVGDGLGGANSATLRLLADNQLPNNSGLITVNADGLLDLNNHVATVDRLAGTGEIATGASGALTIGANNGSSTFDGTLSGTGSLTKTGSGLLTLSTNLTFNGTFILAGGTLRLSDAVFTLETLDLTANSTIDFAGSGSQLYVSNLNLNGFTLSIANWADAADHFYAANWNGAVLDTRGTAPMNQITFNGFTAANTQWQSYDRQVTPVPEPAAYGALLLGCLTLLGLRRHRRS